MAFNPCGAMSFEKREMFRGTLVTFFIGLSSVAAVAQVTASSPAPAPAATQGAAANAVNAPNTVTVFIPKDTLAVVRTTRAYNSYSAHTGEKVEYELVQDLIVNGYVVAKAGDAAEGMVQEGQAGETGFYGIGNKSANLRVSVDEIYNFCGDTIHTDFDRSEYRRRQGMFGENKDVQIIKGQMYVPVVNRPQRVCGEPTAEAPAPIPSDAVRTATK
ncbi:MAG: hypothetical protein WAJ85_14160 [Candidatus Baltobacteraceae bacterium]